MQLRYYQDEAINGGSGYPGVFAALDSHRSTVLDMATGTGKTVIFCAVADRFVRQGKRVLILAHREELIEQAAIKAGRWPGLHGHVGIEMAARRAPRSSLVVAASVDTLGGGRLRSYPPNHFDLVVIDEAHRAVAPGYVEILEHLNAQRLGVTATPDRLDRVPLAKVFDSVAYRYPMHKAISDGYLVPLDPRLVLDETLDLDGVFRTDGTVDPARLARIMERKTNLDLVARATYVLAEDRRTIVFATSVKQAKEIARRLNILNPGSALAVDGDDKDRAQKLKAFSAGQCQYLVNCELYIEGLDVPEVACVVIARPTESRRMYSQMVGRGTRILGASIAESRTLGKYDLMVIDFVGVTEFKSLASPNEVLGWWSHEAGDGSEAQPLPAPQPGADETLRPRLTPWGDGFAESEIEPVRYTAKELDSGSVDQAAALRRLERVRYQEHRASDPFDVLGVSRHRCPYDFKPADKNQLGFLARNEIPGAQEQLQRYLAGEAIPSQGIGNEQASLLIEAINLRNYRRQCPLPTARVLRQAGLNPNCSYAAGYRAMQILRGNGFQITSELRNDPELQVEAHVSF